MSKAHIVTERSILEGVEYTPYPGIQYEIEPKVRVTLRRGTKALVEEVNEVEDPNAEENEEILKLTNELKKEDLSDARKDEIVKRLSELEEGGNSRFVANLDFAIEKAQIIVDSPDTYEWEDPSIQVVWRICEDFFELVLPQQNKQMRLLQKLASNREEKARAAS